MSGIEDKLAKIKAIQAEAEAKKTAEKETKAKESADKKAGLEQEKAQVEGELAQTTEELQKTESGLAEINAMDLSALDAESRAAIESEMVGIKEEMENLSGKVAELTKREQEIDEILKNGADEIEKTSDEGKEGASPELATNEDPELTKLGKDAEMIEVIFGFKIAYSDGLRQGLSKATRNKDAVDINTLDWVISTGNKMIEDVQQSPESVAQTVKEYVNGEIAKMKREAKERHDHLTLYALDKSPSEIVGKIMDLKILPQKSLDTIIEEIQARVDEAISLKQKGNK